MKKIAGIFLFFFVLISTSSVAGVVDKNIAVKFDLYKYITFVSVPVNLIFIVVLVIYFLKKKTTPGAGNEMSSVFYMSVPEEKGFLDKGRKNNIVKGSVFIFKISPNEKNTAYYEVMPGHESLSIIKENYYNDNFKRVCGFLDVLTANTIDFKTDRVGKAVLKRGKWIIEPRTKIQFVNKKKERNEEENDKETAPNYRKVDKKIAEQQSIPISSNDETISLPIPLEIPTNPTVKSSSFYMGIPDGGVFRSYSKSATYKPGISMFAFKEINDKKAKYKMISDAETIKFIKNTFIDNIKPACIITNLPTADTKEINTLEHGIAVFDGENWKIEKQATIKFI